MKKLSHTEFQRSAKDFHPWIHQESREPHFWEVKCFALLAYASLAASRTLLWWSLACLNANLDSEDLFCWHKQKSDFYDSSTSCWKPWKWVRFDLIYEGYIYINSNLNPLTKFTSTSRRYPPMGGYYSNYSHKLFRHFNIMQRKLE